MVSMLKGVDSTVVFILDNYSCLVLSVSPHTWLLREPRGVFLLDSVLARLC